MERYKTFLPRLVALLIDSFIMLPIGILDDWFRQAEFAPLFFYIWIPVSSLVFPVYMILMHASFGQTLGKMAMNVKVLDTSEDPIKVKQAIWRESPQLVLHIWAIILGIALLGQSPEAENVKMSYSVLGTFALIWGVADIMTFFFNDKKRALHDLIAGTVVVKTNL